ncbi:MAG: flavodoxin [Methanobrevibacter sp.]|jgi:flavodoxin|nr:flavodoxin [Methanobrevibacter sp.]
MKTLILYYSESGKSEVVAKTLSSQLFGDLIRIKDLKVRKGFKSKLTSSIDAFRESKTEISPSKIDLKDYDLIYIGTPVWASKPTPAIITAIDKFDFRRKEIILFATMRISGGEKAIKRMEDKLQSRGARVTNSFIIKTQNKNTSNITGDTLDLIESLNLK